MSKKLDSICNKSLTYLGEEYEWRIIDLISHYAIDIFYFGTAMSEKNNVKCTVSTVCCNGPHGKAKHGFPYVSVSRPPNYTIWRHSLASTFPGLHSPKITPVGYLKSNVYLRAATALKNWKWVANINGALLHQAMQNFRQRSQQCIECYGGYLKQMPSKNEVMDNRLQSLR